jgi:hypothetical protein
MSAGLILPVSNKRSRISDVPWAPYCAHRRDVRSLIPRSRAAATGKIKPGESIAILCGGHRTTLYPSTLPWGLKSPSGLSLRRYPPGLSTTPVQVMAGVDLVHVPYRGLAPALTDLIGGPADPLSGTLSSAIRFFKTRGV